MARLPDREQDAFARWLLDELESERRWSRAFHASQGRIAEMAREAVADGPADRTGADVTRRLNELFADPELRREHLQNGGRVECSRQGLARRALVIRHVRVAEGVEVGAERLPIDPERAPGGICDDGTVSPANAARRTLAKLRPARTGWSKRLPAPPRGARVTA